MDIVFDVAQEPAVESDIELLKNAFQMYCRIF